MSGYIVYKRVSCPECEKRRVGATGRGLSNICRRCGISGKIEIPVDLLEVLAKVRFAIDGVPSDKFEVLRIEESDEPMNVETERPTREKAIPHATKVYCAECQWSGEYADLNHDPNGEVAGCPQCESYAVIVEPETEKL